MSPSKESVKVRAQRPGSRLQELEQELAKIHHRGPALAAANNNNNNTTSSPQPIMTPPVITSCYHTTTTTTIPPQPTQSQTQQHQTQPQQHLLATVVPVSTIPVATVTPNIISAANVANADNPDPQENVDVCFFFLSSINFLF